MKIYEYTQDELETYRRECNFTDIERKCFDLKAKDKTDYQIAMELNISESTVAVKMRGMREKIYYVMRKHAQQNMSATNSDNNMCAMCPNRVYHTMREWQQIPDFKSSRGVEYVYADYRTEIIDGVEINVPRVKYGDGIHSVSELPFATMSIMPKDMCMWDGRTELDGNNFGDVIKIGSECKEDNKFVFPTDGYLMLKFDTDTDFAKVNICSASGKSFFIFEKPPRIDIHSKEVFVRKGMKCAHVSASSGAEVRFIPLI